MCDYMLRLITGTSLRPPGGHSPLVELKSIKFRKYKAWRMNASFIYQGTENMTNVSQTTFGQKSK